MFCFPQILLTVFLLHNVVVSLAHCQLSAVIVPRAYFLFVCVCLCVCVHWIDFYSIDLHSLLFILITMLNFLLNLVFFLVVTLYPNDMRGHHNEVT